MPLKVVGIIKQTKIGVVVQNRQPSLRAIQAVKNMVGNGGNKTQAMRDAGYAEATINTPGKVFGSATVVKNLVDPVVAKMIKERDAILALMAKKRKTANYAVLSMAARNMNHDIQVLSGRPTEIIDKPLDSDEERLINEILSRNA